MSKEAMKLALEALNTTESDCGSRAWEREQEAITAMREALAEQPAQQEPKKDLMWSTVAMQERHDQRIQKVVATLEQIKQEQLAEQPAQQKLVATFGPLAKRRIFDYIRGAYDLGYNDARNAKAIPGDGAPGYKGRDVETDHGSALLHALEAITSPQAQRKPLTEEEVDANLRRNGSRYADDSDVRMKNHGEWQRNYERSIFRAAETAHGIKENT